MKDPRTFQNKENGNILTYEEMLKEGAELYDLDDPSNICSYSDYYIAYIEMEEKEMKRDLNIIHCVLDDIYEAATKAEIVKENIEELLEGEQYDDELWDEGYYWEDLYDKLIELTTEIEERYKLIED